MEGMCWMGSNAELVMTMTDGQLKMGNGYNCFVIFT